MNVHNAIDYVEFPARDIPATQAFFKIVFGWSFENFGADYIAFSKQGLDGGFFASNLQSSSAEGAALVVLFSHNLAATEAKIKAAGGIITKPIFSFPGGRRFHFTEPSGNELAVWSDSDE